MSVSHYCEPFTRIYFSNSHSFHCIYITHSPEKTCIMRKKIHTKARMCSIPVIHLVCVSVNEESPLRARSLTAAAAVKLEGSWGSVSSTGDIGASLWLCSSCKFYFEICIIWSLVVVWRSSVNFVTTAFACKIFFKKNFERPVPFISRSRISSENFS